jgi:endo-1,4-beta-xylanase
MYTVSSGTWTNETLAAVIQTHIANEVAHYKGQCYSWDVVNEALADDGSYRTSVFYNVMGTDYIPVAFKAAAEADDSAKLYYNDYNIEYSGTKQKKALEIVQLIQDAGARIDGVGLQGHFIVSSAPSQSDLTSVMQQYIDAGVSELAYTELDIRFSSLPASDSDLEEQATAYANVVNACLAVSECVGITIWDFTDKYSWIPSTFSGAGEACLYDENLSKKPAYTTVSSILAAAATGGSASGSAVASAVATSKASTVASSKASSAAVATSKAVTSTKAAAASTSTLATSVRVSSSSSKAAATTAAATVTTSKASTAAAAATTSAASSSSRPKCARRRRSNL